MSKLPFFDPTRPPPLLSNPVCFIDPFYDQSIVTDFVSTKNVGLCTSSMLAIPTVSSINQLKCVLVELIKEVECLRSQKEALEKVIDTQPDLQYHTSLAKLKQLQQSVTSKLTRLNDTALRSQLRKKLHTRRKKREWKKRRNSRLRQEQAAAIQNRRILHEQIDQWQKEQWKQVEKEKQTQLELDIANQFLADVHRRKAACKRYIIKFQKLKDRHSSVEFSDLTKIWNAKLSECIKEEKRLKDVLARRSTSNYQRRVENEWNKVLFGDAIPKKFEHPLLLAERNRDALIETRRGWDTCLVDAENNEGSYIPLGWVLPPLNPTAEWANYQLNDSI